MTSHDLEVYIESRLATVGYRGIHLAQHNRIPAPKLVTLLDAIRAVVGQNWFPIPPGDDPNPKYQHTLIDERPLSLYADYHRILDEVKGRGEQATFNSLKKNHFPNFEHMALLERTSGESPNRGRLTAEAVAILDETNPRKRLARIGSAHEALFESRTPGLLDRLIELMDSLDTLTDLEVMLFVSDGDASIDETEHRIRTFRRMRLFDRIMFLHDLRGRCMATMGKTRPKIDMRDWGNWRNEAQQIISMLELIQGFTVPWAGTDIIVVCRSDKTVPPSYQPGRSQVAKTEAMAWHDLSLDADFELHHVVPIEYVASASDMAKVDHAQNLLYLRRGAHRQIPTKGNMAIKLSVTATHVVLEHPLDATREPRFEFALGTDARIDLVHAPEMVNYNDALLAHVGA